MSFGTERRGVKNLGGFKREILRYAQNDKKIVLRLLIGITSRPLGRNQNTKRTNSLVQWLINTIMYV